MAIFAWGAVKLACGVNGNETVAWSFATPRKRQFRQESELDQTVALPSVHEIEAAGLGRSRSRDPDCYMTRSDSRLMMTQLQVNRRTIDCDGT